MRFLNPKTDFAFKKIFGSEQSREILLSFLNAILQLESPYRIADLQILDPYLAPKIHGMKDTYLDVRAQDEQGKWYIIEMQVLNVAGFEKRVLYNACKTYAGQIQRGEDYHLLTDVIAITITDFTMFENQPSVISKYRLRADDGHVYSDDLELVFAELTKFNKTETQLDSLIDRWLYFLKHADDLSVIPAPLQSEPAICQAFNIANIAGLSPDELLDQERREMFIQDQRGAIELALQRGVGKGREEGLAEGREKGREEGREEGREVGREEGREEGKQAERLRIAASLLDILDDDHLIAAKTGLTEQDIKPLRLARDAAPN